MWFFYVNAVIPRELNCLAWGEITKKGTIFEQRDLVDTNTLTLEVHSFD